jgi:hypothetical protein
LIDPLDCSTETQIDLRKSRGGFKLNELGKGWYVAAISTALGGGCAGSHISAAMMETFLRALDKKWLSVQKAGW